MGKKLNEKKYPTVMIILYHKIKAILELGVLNLIRVGIYRFGLMTGIHSVQRISAVAPQGPFFDANELPGYKLPVMQNWRNEVLYFGYNHFKISEDPPNWHQNPLTGQKVNLPERPWWLIPDFDMDVGDIKAIWEMSRFEWVLAFAQSASSGESVEIHRLNNWLKDWCAKNPPYFGPNWKCGQEASIRVMHLAMAAIILRQAISPTRELIELIRLHLQRIAPTIGYALAQDNNHGTSEAAALFIGGSWLEYLGVKGGKHWRRLGRKWLENRAARLIETDGSFSQHSINYHRMLLDTFSMVELWRRHFGLSEFSVTFKSRSTAAACWLAKMVDSYSGDAPNIGSNDGTRLLVLTDSDYRDFRPSVQLAMALFTGDRAYYNNGSWDAQLAWLGVASPEKMSGQSGSRVFADGGYAVLHRKEGMVLLRYPRFRFRPSQADALHLDFWLKGNNLLRDAGTYSYNTNPEWLDYFSGTASHNTVQFDDRDQMPRISRFLFGNWLKTEQVQPIMENAKKTTCGAVYSDGQGARHKRTVQLCDDRLIVQDEVSGFVDKAVLRWRLKPGNWCLKGQNLSNEGHILSIGANVPLIRFELIDGWESRYYLQKTPVPVIEVEIHKPGILTTEYCWAR